MEEHICCNCGREAKYQLKNKKWYCEKSANSCPAVKEKVKQRVIDSWKNPNRGKNVILPIIDNGLCSFDCGKVWKFKLNSGKYCCCSHPFKCDKIKEKIKNNTKNKKYESFKNGRVIWNKGLTKKTDERIRKSSDALSQHYKDGSIIHPFLGKKHTEETKLRMSQTNNGNRGGYRKHGGRGKRGYYKGYWCDSSWELAWVIYSLDHGIKFERNTKSFKYEFEGKLHKYHPDFILEDGSYVEIKGRRNLNECEAKIFAKISVVKDIKLLLQEDMKVYLTYAINKFGKDFIKVYEKAS